MNIRSHVDCNAGVKPLPESAAGIKVYPNPSNGSFTVEVSETNGGATITITDVLGKTIETRIIGGNEKKAVFRLTNIAAGSYLVKVNAGNKTYRDKIVIW
jgi:hypothetical protein